MSSPIRLCPTRQRSTLPEDTGSALMPRLEGQPYRSALSWPGRSSEARPVDCEFLEGLSPSHAAMQSLACQLRVSR